MLASPFISQLFNENHIFYHFLTFNIVSILIYDCMAEPVLGRLPGRPLTHWPTSILMVDGPFILLLFIKCCVFDHFWMFCINLKLIYHYMAEPVLGWLPGRPLAHWPTIFLMLASPFILLLFIENHFLSFFDILCCFKINLSLYGRAGAGPVAWLAISTLANLNFDVAGPIVFVFYMNASRISIFGCTVSRPVYMAFLDSQGSAQCAGPGNGTSRHSVVPLCATSHGIDVSSRCNARLLRSYINEHTSSSCFKCTKYITIFSIDKNAAAKHVDHSARTSAKANALKASAIP